MPTLAAHHASLEHTAVHTQSACHPTIAQKQPKQGILCLAFLAGWSLQCYLYYIVVIVLFYYAVIPVTWGRAAEMDFKKDLIMNP